MIIDFHTHCFPEHVAATAIANIQSTSHTAAYAPGSEIGLLRSMSEAGIDLSVNLPVATNPQKVYRMNERFAQRNAESERTVINFGCIHPLCTVREEIKHISSLGLKGIKLHPYFHHCEFDSPVYLEILEAAGEEGLIVVTHAGRDLAFHGQDLCNMSQIESALRKVGQIKLVLAHMGGWHNWRDLDVLDAFPNVMFDISCCLTEPEMLCGYEDKSYEEWVTVEEVVSCVKRFGAHRFLFGSDSPWSPQKSYVRMLSELPFSEEEKDMIFRKNAARLLNMD